MSKTNRAMLDAIQELAGRDLDETTDEQIRAEFVEDGYDPTEVAGRVTASLDSVIAEFRRTRAAASKAVMNTTIRPMPSIRPAMDRIKELIQSAFNSDPKLASAFRDGKKQTDNDLLSLYDDLVSMGKIDPDDAH